MNSRMALPPNQGPISAPPDAVAAGSLLPVNPGLDPQITPRVNPGFVPQVTPLPGILGSPIVPPVAPIPASPIPTFSQISQSLDPSFQGPSFQGPVNPSLPTFSEISQSLEESRPVYESSYDPFDELTYKRPRRADYDAETGYMEYVKDLRRFRRSQGQPEPPQRDQRELAEIMLRSIGREDLIPR